MTDNQALHRWRFLERYAMSIEEETAVNLTNYWDTVDMHNLKILSPVSWDIISGINKSTTFVIVFCLFKTIIDLYRSTLLGCIWWLMMVNRRYKELSLSIQERPKVKCTDLEITNKSCAGLYFLLQLWP